MLDAAHVVVQQRHALPLSAAANAPRSRDYDWSAGSGRFAALPPVLLDNQAHDERAGVRAYRVFFRADAAPLLVELGWLPLPGDRRMPQVPRPEGAIRIAGLLTPPPSAGIATAIMQPQADGTLLTIALDLPLLRKALALPSLAPRVLKLDPASRSATHAISTCCPTPCRPNATSATPCSGSGWRWPCWSRPSSSLSGNRADDRTLPEPEPRRERRNRMMLIAIFAIFFGSLFVAGALRFSGWRPAGTKAHGEMLQPPGDLRAVVPKLADGGDYAWNPRARLWRIALAPPADCIEACIKLAHDLDTVWQLTGQDADHVHVLWIGTPPPAMPRDAALRVLQSALRCVPACHASMSSRPTAGEACRCM